MLHKHMLDKKIKILIVDDDDATRGLYAEVFKKNNFEVLEAVDGADGLDKAATNQPDIVFTGIIMPRMDGFALFEALKKNAATGGIPVVISSHMGREEDRQKALGMGAKDFITRDFNTPNDVVERIMAIFKISEYKIKFNPNDPDAVQLAKEMHFNEKFQCSVCGGEAVLALKIKDISAHEFSARFICSKCGKSQD